MNGCTFCEIVDGTRSAQIVYRTPRFVVFEPATRTADKVLIVPVAHAESLASMSIEDLGDWLGVAYHMSSVLRAHSYRMQINVGSTMQNVRHIYMQFSYHR